MSNYRAIFDMYPFDVAIEKIREQVRQEETSRYQLFTLPKTETVMAPRYSHRNGESETPEIEGIFCRVFPYLAPPARGVVQFTADDLGILRDVNGRRADDFPVAPGIRWYGPWEPWNEEG